MTLFIIIFVGTPSPASILAKLTNLTLSIKFIVSIAIISLIAVSIGPILDVDFHVLGCQNLISKDCPCSNFRFGFLKL